MKPNGIGHLISRLDGRLLLDPWAPPASELRQAVSDEHERLHREFGAEAWLSGTRTMAEIAHGASASAGVRRADPLAQRGVLLGPAARRPPEPVVEAAG